MLKHWLAEQGMIGSINVLEPEAGGSLCTVDMTTHKLWETEEAAAGLKWNDIVGQTDIWKGGQWHKQAKANSLLAAALLTWADN